MACLLLTEGTSGNGGALKLVGMCTFVALLPFCVSPRASASGALRLLGDWAQAGSLDVAALHNHNPGWAADPFQTHHLEPATSLLEKQHVAWPLLAWLGGAISAVVVYREVLCDEVQLLAPAVT
jgi:hypothetical protein